MIGSITFPKQMNFPPIMKAGVSFINRYDLPYTVCAEKIEWF